MPRGRKKKVVEPQVVRRSKVISVQEISKNIEELRTAGKDPAVLRVGQKTFEVLRMNPWFGDNGTDQTFHGVKVEVSGKDSVELE